MQLWTLNVEWKSEQWTWTFLSIRERSCEKCELWEIELAMCSIHCVPWLVGNVNSKKKGLVFPYIRNCQEFVCDLTAMAVRKKILHILNMQFHQLTDMCESSEMCDTEIENSIGLMAPGNITAHTHTHTLNRLVSLDIEFTYCTNYIELTRILYLNTIYILCAFSQRTEITVLLAICKE